MSAAMDNQRAAKAPPGERVPLSGRGGRGAPGDARGSKQEGRRAPAGLGVLEKIVGMLDLFTVDDPEWTATGLSRTLGMPFPTAHRLAGGLERYGLLERTADGAYRLGPGAVDLGRRAYLSLDLRTLSAPALRWLHRETDETCSLSTIDERVLGARCIDAHRGSYPFRLYADVESVSPLHAGAIGKALLARASDDLLARVVRAGLASCASGTITDPVRLRKDLAKVRSAGYAFDEQELVDGAWGMAAPILRPDGTVAASIGFIAPVVRLTPTLRRRGAEMVVVAAEMARAALAGEAPPG